jgi:GntR family transcriptional regulator/MocR family aminotransferase
MGMYLQLDGPGPLYAQLSRALKKALASGGLGEGNRLPPTRLLASELGISRNTVLTAYEQLRMEGVLEGKVGSGSYVSVPPRHPPTAPPAPISTDPVGQAQSAYASRARRFHASAKPLGHVVPGTRYSLQYGMPMANPVLTTAWAQELSRAAHYTSPNYPIVQGLPALRQAISEYLMRQRGVLAAPDDILVVGGTQQAIALTARVLLDPGARVVVEDPQYNNTRIIMQCYGAELQPVPVDENGIDCNLLPDEPPRLICVTPSHQFPTGAQMPLARREALLDYARRHDSWVFEDDYDGELRYDAKPLASLRMLDRDDRVIYVGTFSKVLFPSLRLGYMVVPRDLRRDFVSAKWLEDFGCSAIEQAAMANFMSEGGFERHLRRVGQALRQRRNGLLAGLHELSQGRMRIVDSQAGMHLTLWLHDLDRSQGEAFIAHARRMGLGLYPLWPYYLSPPDRAGLILGYAGLPAADIKPALAIFRECLEQAYQPPGVAGAEPPRGPCS